MVAAVWLIAAAATAATTAAIIAFFIGKTPLPAARSLRRQSSAYRSVGLIPVRENWSLGQFRPRHGAAQERLSTGRAATRTPGR
jgi:hypothetical protein